MTDEQSIAVTLNAVSQLCAAEWDRCTGALTEITVFGWVPRPDGHKDFLSIDFQQFEAVSFVTSSAEYSESIGQLIFKYPGRHEPCEPILDVIAGVEQVVHWGRKVMSDPMMSGLQDRLIHVRPPTVSPKLDAFMFYMLALTGEAGEAANKAKKMWRGDDLDFEEWRIEVLKELADVSVYAERAAHELGATLDQCLELKAPELVERGYMYPEAGNTP